MMKKSATYRSGQKSQSVAGNVAQRKANNTGLPDSLKSGIENLSGHSMDYVKVHYNSSRSAQLQAHAFAQGNQIHIAAGQEKHLPHEALHVVQQKQGRVKPTIQLKSSIPVNDDPGLEKEADVMGEKALMFKKSNDLMSIDNKRAVESSPVASIQFFRGVVQRQLVDSGHGYEVDNRDQHHYQHFTLDPPNNHNHEYRDQQDYRYRYNVGTRELLVLGGQANRYWDTEHQQELRKDINGVKHIYRNGGQRYYYRNHRYHAVPNQRVRWVDNHGHFVDQHGRVLTNNGARVQKHYAITKNATREYVLPYKLQQGYMAGLPNLFGGNMDAGDADAHVAMAREVDEESDWHQELQAGSQQLNAVNQGGNRLHFHEATVTARGAAARILARPHNPPAAEMAGTFGFKASSFNINHQTSDANIRGQILNKFTAQTGANLGAAFFNNALAHQNGTPLQQFHAAHSTVALVAKIRADHASYHAGLVRAQAHQGAQQQNNVEYMAGFNLYTLGLQRAEAGQGAQQAAEPSYMAGFDQYNAGMARAQSGQGAQHQNQHSYMAGFAQYNAGMARAQSGQGAQHQNQHSYMAGFAQYNAGIARAQSGQGAQHQNQHSYMAGFAQYNAGMARARGGQPAQHHNQDAYMRAYTEYMQGILPAQLGLAAQQPNHAAYIRGYNDAINGILDHAQNHHAQPQQNHHGYLMGYYYQA
ncbi:DUF4157 domain-containing protein [Ekhidna sp.]|uniref:eCIS core domain-containing protein n=1 Tax=Ekhidna sp. TaxID=2608089 RepID=UPI0032976EA8